MAEDRDFKPIKWSDRLKNICLNCISEFDKKQGTSFEYAVADDYTGIIAVSDMFFNMSDIIHDLDNNVETGKIIEWYYYTVESESRINYKSYLMGAREKPIGHA